MGTAFGPSFNVRLLKKDQREEMENIRQGIQQHFGFMPSHYFMQQPRTAQTHINNITCRTNLNPDQQEVMNRLDTFVKTTRFSEVRHG